MEGGITRNIYHSAMKKIVIYNYFILFINKNYILLGYLADCTDLTMPLLALFNIHKRCVIIYTRITDIVNAINGRISDISSQVPTSDISI